MMKRLSVIALFLSVGAWATVTIYPAALSHANALFLQGRTLASTAPSDGDVISWNNSASQWEPKAASGGGGIVGASVAQGSHQIVGNSGTDVFSFSTSGTTNVSHGVTITGNTFVVPSTGWYQISIHGNAQHNDQGINYIAAYYKVNSGSPVLFCLGQADPATSGAYPFLVGSAGLYLTAGDAVSFIMLASVAAADWQDGTVSIVGGP